jgi:hypothetical protein
MKLYGRRIFSSIITQHKYLVDVGWRYLKNALQLKFKNSVELTHVLVDTSKIIVSVKYCSSFGEFISKFPLLKLGGTCRIINNC